MARILTKLREASPLEQWFTSSSHMPLMVALSFFKRLARPAEFDLAERCAYSNIHPCESVACSPRRYLRFTLSKHLVAPVFRLGKASSHEEALVVMTSGQSGRAIAQIGQDRDGDRAGAAGSSHHVSPRSGSMPPYSRVKTLSALRSAICVLTY